MGPQEGCASCNAQRCERTEERRDNRFGHFKRKLHTKGRLTHQEVR